jgi:AraC-like DNA-binding protein
MSTATRYHRPRGLLAGFHAELPDSDVPELRHAGEQWAPGTYRIPDHVHDVWEFYLQVDGQSLWDGPGQSGGEHTYTLRSGSFFAVAPHVVHRLHEDTHEYSKGKHHFFFAAVDLEEVARRHPQLTATWPRREVVFAEHAESLIPPFRQLVREISVDLPQRATGIRLAIDSLVLEASRLFRRALPSPLVTLHPAVAHARELLDRQPQRLWTLGDLARLTGLSPSHLAECFTRDIGVPPHRYLVGARSERARQLLRDSDVPITQLATELGFASSQHFAASFKKLTGATASAYRSRSRAG